MKFGKRQDGPKESGWHARGGTAEKKLTGTKRPEFLDRINKIKRIKKIGITAPNAALRLEEPPCRFPARASKNPLNLLNPVNPV